MATSGRKAFKKTEEQIKEVKLLSGFGIPQEQISAYLKISTDTLQKYFKDEMLEGKATANAKISQVLFQKAIGGNVPALIFWAKTQMKWKETSGVELTGEDGGNIEISDAKAKLLAGIVIKEEKKDE